MKNKYNGDVNRAIKDFIELLENFEDAVDIELRKKEESEPWSSVKKELNLSFMGSGLEISHLIFSLILYNRSAHFSIMTFKILQISQHLKKHLEKS